MPESEGIETGSKYEMLDDEKLAKRYESLHRAFCGLTVICFVVTVIGSVTAGATTAEVVYRGFLVIAAVSFASHIAIRIWVKWEEVQSVGATVKKKSS